MGNKSSRIRTKDGVVNLEDSVSERLKHSAEDAQVTEEHVNIPDYGSKQESVFEFDQLPIDKSPLTSQPVSIMDHVTGMDNGIKTEGNPFENDPEPTVSKPAAEVPKFEFPEDAPSLKTTTDSPQTPSASNGSDSSLPGNIKTEITNSLADVITDLYRQIVPNFEYEFTKIDMKQMNKYAADGYIDPIILESLKNANKENKKKFKEQASQDAAMLKKPLAKVLNEKNIQTTPTTELMIVMVVILIGNVFLIREIRTENSQLHKSIHDRITELNAQREREAIEREARRKAQSVEEVK